MSRAKAWLRGERDHVAELGSLGLAFLVANQTVAAGAITLWPAISGLLVASLVIGRGASTVAARRTLPNLLRRLGVGVVAVAVIGAAFHFVFGLPYRSHAFAPLWLLALIGWHTPLLRVRMDSRGWVTRRHVLLGEAALVAAAGYLAAHFVPGFWGETWVAATLWAGWVALRLALRGDELGAPVRYIFGRMLGSLAAAGVLGFFLLQLGGAEPGRVHFVFFLWTSFALGAHRLLLRKVAPAEERPLENTRWVALLATSLFVLGGFGRTTLHGTPDALWYGTMLADMVAQTREGVFPVWLGQSVYQFNGAIYPLRVAPLFHYLGTLLDTLTAQSLGIFALQNLLITLVGIAGTFTTYFGLAHVLGRSRWLAAGLAILWLTCPGVLGIAYNTDLYMSWTTLPWVSLVWVAGLGSFRQRGSLNSMLLLGGALGLCWWGHSPIALWCTLLSAIVQIGRVLVQRPTRAEWGFAVAGAALCAAIAAFPVGSVLLFPPEAGVRSASFQAASPATIAHFLREAFPATLLPVSPIGRSLGDFQLGYALWAIGALAVWNWRRTPAGARVLLSLALVLALLLQPWPGFDVKFWSLVPDFVRNTTGNWVMNRLYLILASLLVCGIAASAGTWDRDGRARRILALVVAFGIAWSLLEARKFTAGSAAGRRPAASAVDLLRPENVQITRFAYLVFPALPPSFSHGVVEPALEHRILFENSAPPPRALIDFAQAAATPVAAAAFSVPPNAGSAFVECTTPLQLQPGKRYLLNFAFAGPPEARGVLQLSGPSFFREYALPDYGGLHAFGSGPTHRRTIGVHTTATQTEALRIRFFPEAGTLPARKLLPFATVSLLEYDPAHLPVVVESWVPYRARVTMPTAGWLETPRMFQENYVARVSGQPTSVRKSDAGLVAVPLPAGASTVELAYRAPIALQALFWLSLLAIVAAVAVGLAAWPRAAWPEEANPTS